MTKKILLLLLILPAVIFAQSQRQTIYNAAPNCYVQGFIPLQGGGNLLGGYSRYGTDSSLINLVFLNDSDMVVSHKDFNTATHLDFMSCIVQGGNGFLIGGKSSDTNFFHPQLIKTDLNGNVIWAKYFDNTSYWHGQIIRILPNGNNFSMYTYAETPTNDLYRIEADANGNISTGFSCVPNTPMSFRVFDAEAIPNSSSHILCGHGNFNTASTRAGLLMKTNQSGVEWCKHITAGGNFKNDIVDVTAAADGNSYSVFVCENMPGNQYSTIVLKYDSAGNQVWAKQLSINNGTLNGCSVIESTAHDFFVASYDNLLNAYITKITAAGNVSWTHKWLPSSSGGATALKLFKDVSGNIVFTGMLGNSYFVSRLDADAAGCSFANSTVINVTNATTVLTNITFTNTPFTGNAVAEPVTYSSLAYAESMICGGVGVEEVENANALSVYPNPVHSRLNIKTDNALSKDSRLEIYDAFGKCVLGRSVYATTSDATTSVDVSAFATGIYFLKIYSGDKIYRSRFVVD